MRMEGEHTMMRIFVGEEDRQGNQPLYRAIIQLLRSEGLAGATVTRGIAGFGAQSVLHTTSILRLSRDLPVVIEAVDTREKIDAILPRLAA